MPSATIFFERSPTIECTNPLPPLKVEIMTIKYLSFTQPITVKMPFLSMCFLCVVQQSELSQVFTRKMILLSYKIFVTVA
jgi:hypothetical protein